MVTGFDVLHSNTPLQKHWLKRVIAYVIDLLFSSFVVYVIMMALGLLIPNMIIYFFPVAGMVQVFYSAVFEYYKRQTLGKIILDLQVEPLKASLELNDCLLRNISKVHGVLVLLDTLVGLATEGDPRQRYTDRIAYTTVRGAVEPHHFDQFLMGHRYEKKEDTRDKTSQLEKPEKRSCRECGGNLEEIDFGQSRCTECGRIQ